MKYEKFGSFVGWILSIGSPNRTVFRGIRLPDGIDTPHAPSLSFLLSTFTRSTTSTAPAMSSSKHKAPQLFSRPGTTRDPIASSVNRIDMVDICVGHRNLPLAKHAAVVVVVRSGKCMLIVVEEKAKGGLYNWSWEWKSPQTAGNCLWHRYL